MSANPVFFVNGPQPIVPKHRLVDLPGVVLPGDDPHWRLGVRVWPFQTDPPTGWDPCSEGTYRVKEEPTAQPENPEFAALTIVGVESCSTFSIHNQEEYKARAISVFEAGKSAVIEEQLIAGSFVTAPYLADSDVDMVNSGTAVGSVAALAALENEIALTRRGGVIITDPAVATAWTSNYLLEEDAQGTLRTINGTPVIAAHGAVGLRPDGESAPTLGYSWAWATGMIHAFVGDPYVLPEDVKQALERETNLITYRAEAPALVYWDTELQVAVQVDWTS